MKLEVEKKSKSELTFPLKHKKDSPNLPNAQNILIHRL